MARELPPLRGLDLNLLVTLRTLLRRKSVSRAAEALGQSQPAVSRALASLRATFDDPLLIRSGRGMVATPLGESLLRPVERSLAEIDGLLSLNAFDATQDARHFRLAMPSILGLVFAPPWALHVETEAPHCTFQMLGIHEGTSAALLNGEIDLLIGGSVIDHPEVFRRAITTRMEWAVIGGERSPVRDGMSVEEWANALHVQFVTAGRPDTRGRFDALLMEHYRLERRVAFKLEHVSALGSLLSSTRLVASLPRPSAEHIARSYGLQLTEHPMTRVLSALAIQMSWHQTLNRDPGHTWLRDAAAATLEHALWREPRDAG
ncbi:MAG: LysR family transcriptional regulator [Myxococcota bacterium]